MPLVMSYWVYLPLLNGMKAFSGFLVFLPTYHSAHNTHLCPPGTGCHSGGVPIPGGGGAHRPPGLPPEVHRTPGHRPDHLSDRAAPLHSRRRLLRWAVGHRCPVSMCDLCN